MARLSREGRKRTQRGAAAVEAGIVVSFVLVPLLLGVLTWGDFFWRAQRVDTLAPAVPEGQVFGTMTCQGLKDTVKLAVLNVVDGLNPDLEELDVNDITVTVLELLPDVGVTVEIHIEVPASGGLASLVPLPGGGALVTDFTQQLNDVRVSDVTCR